MLGPRGNSDDFKIVDDHHRRAARRQGKAKKLGWLKRRKFVKGCIVEALKGYPNVNVEKVMTEMDTQKLPVAAGGNAI